MNSSVFPVVAIVGPTASGKTELAQRAAESLHAEVLSCDSMQIYRGMDIGTAKLLPADRRVVHHGFDLVAPGEPYSAALYQKYARGVIDVLTKTGKRCVVCGGTGFYLRAALDQFDFPKGEQVDNPLRKRLNALAQSEGNQVVWDLLYQADPTSAHLIPPNDIKRVIRALELHEEGISYATQRENFGHIEPYYPSIYFGLSVDPAVLRKRIDTRVDRMIEEGLIDEVESLLHQGLRDGLTAPQAIGYKEIVASLEGEISIDSAIEQIKTASRRYAKRQRTWFRKDKRIIWLEATNYDVEYLLHEMLKVLATKMKH